MSISIRAPKKGWPVIHLALLGGAAWIGAGMVAGWLGAGLTVSSAPKSSMPRAAGMASTSPDVDLAVILRRNLFNSAQTEPEGVGAVGLTPSEGELETAPRTTLGLRLVGTVAAGGEGTRLAAIERKDNQESKVYRLNDEIMGAQIVRIERNKVYLSRNGITEVLPVDLDERSDPRAGPGRRIVGGPPGADVTEQGEGNFVLSDRYIKAQLANMSSLLTQVRAVPNVTKEGIADGFKLFSIKKGSIFDKIGFKDHDVVKRVNGVELDSAEKGLELFQALRNEKSFLVDIDRSDAKKTLTFNIQ